MNKVLQTENCLRKAKLAWAGMIFLILLALPYSAVGELNLGARVRNHSLDGRLVQLSGGIACDTGTFIGWWYEWGDGTTSSSWFPTYHRYERPGTYEILVKGYDDQGNSKTVSVEHEVLPTPVTNVNDVHLSEYFVGLSGHDHTGHVEITARDASGETVPLSEHDVELYDPMYNEPTPAFNTHMEGSSLIVTRNVDFVGIGGIVSIGYVYVFVDGVEAEKPVTVILNKNEATYGSLVGDYTVTYLPQMFFDMSEMPEQDYVKILDLGYQFGNWCARDLLYEAGRMLFGVTYNPSTHGASGNPLRIGDSAMPKNGIPRVGIILHEMGHTFQSLPICLRRFGTHAGPFYQETMSEWIKQSTYHMILSQHKNEIGQIAYDMLETSRDESRELHRKWYEQYVEEGCPFDYSVTLYGSQPLVHLIYEYSNEHGWDRIRRFMDHFQYGYVPDLARIFASYGGIELIENKATMMAAALSSTFHADVREDFNRLNFPLNNSLYDDLMDLFTASQPDLNGDGIVDIKDLLRLIESWGQDDPAVDIAPPPFGDGIVDAVDLELLMSYWEQPVERIASRP